MYRVLCLIGLLFTSLTNATLINYSDRTTFENSGFITNTYGFEDFGSLFTPASPKGESFISNGVEYTAPINLIVGPDTSHNPLSNVFVSALFTQVTANIIQAANAITLFGFDLSYVGIQSDTELELKTNLASYFFNLDNLQHASLNSNFFGFSVSGQEFFTSLSITAALPGSAPALDNVTLGTFSPRVQSARLQLRQPIAVPEPSLLSLLSLSLLGLFYRKIERS